jgi:hypothetical protein
MTTLSEGFRIFPTEQRRIWAGDLPGCRSVLDRAARPSVWGGGVGVGGGAGVGQRESSGLLLEPVDEERDSHRGRGKEKAPGPWPRGTRETAVFGGDRLSTVRLKGPEGNPKARRCSSGCLAAMGYKLQRFAGRPHSNPGPAPPNPAAASIHARLLAPFRRRPSLNHENTG